MLSETGNIRQKKMFASDQILVNLICGSINGWADIVVES